MGMPAKEGTVENYFKQINYGELQVLAAGPAGANKRIFQDVARPLKEMGLREDQIKCISRDVLKSVNGGNKA